MPKSDQQRSNKCNKSNKKASFKLQILHEAYITLIHVKDFYRPIQMYIIVDPTNTQMGRNSDPSPEDWAFPPAQPDTPSSPSLRAENTVWARYFHVSLN